MYYKYTYIKDNSNDHYHPSWILINWGGEIISYISSKSIKE